jgi:outer membrane immunogenic protein
MKKILLGTVGLLALGLAPAVAADLPARTYTKAPAYVAAVYDWSGFYIGANGGYGWSKDSWNGGINGADFGSHTADGAVAGGQIGYRWQTGSWVFGLEAQGDWADIKGSHVDLVTPAFTDNSKLKAFGLFTGQVGYAWNNALLYAKGGAAVTSTSYDYFAPGGFQGSTGDRTRWGGTAGAGLEYGFASNWSVGVEYDHLFIDRKTEAFAGTVPGSFRTGGDTDLVTARINYRWGGPAVAKY